MKRIGYIAVSIALLLLVVFGLYAYARYDADRQNQARKPSPSVSADRPDTPGAYVDYTEAALAEAQGSRILFFYAPWCPQCRQLDEDIKSSSLPKGVTILKTDYDSNQELRQKYGVTLQTTLVKLDANGDLVDKYVAYNEPTLDNVIANLVR